MARKTKQQIPFDWTFLPWLRFHVDGRVGPHFKPGQILRWARTYLRMTQTQMAAKSGIPQAHIARIEKGQIDPQWSTMVRLLTTLECSPTLHLRPHAPSSSLEDILDKRIRESAWKRAIKSDPADREEDEKYYQQRLTEFRSPDIWDEE